ncbi:MAG TPA: tetratricopeptide repeat protein [Polyangiaceae bacterium]|nr:tetratricopeptide repeat protein [Polyangiaceae bacterium]
MTDPQHLPHREDDAEAFELTPRPAAAPEVPEPEQSALEPIEALVLQDPGDDVLRATYLRLADAENQQLRAANALARAAGANEAAVRERIWFDAATLYMQEAELPRARSAFMQSVLAGVGGTSGLAAARRVLDLEVDPGDPEVIAPALALIAWADPEPTLRHSAARRLLALHASAPQDDARLVVALRALATHDESVGWLTSLRERDPRRALELCRGVLEADPSSPEWLARLDDWLGESEAPADRLTRYEAALEHAAAPERKVALTRAIAVLRRDALEDLPGAIDAWQRVLLENPGDREATDAIVAASSKMADAAVHAAVVRARPALRGRERHEVTLRVARALAREGEKAAAVALCRELLDEANVGPSILQAIAEIAHDEDDPLLHRSALELLVRSGVGDAKRRALERLGDFQFTQLRDPRAAAESWRPAAQMCEASPAEQAHAQGLYERVLEALPDDRDAAHRLAALYRQSADWAKLPGVLRVLIRTDLSEEKPARLLLDLEKDAIAAGAAEEYVSLLDDVLARTRPEAKETARALKRARARVLSADPTRQDQASLVYRELIESLALDEDVRDFESFIEARASAQERHLDRRWLYGWRAEREARPLKVLLDWGRAEDEFGEAEAAIAVYQRLADLHPGQREALEALCRLRLHAGDFEGGLSALRSLRDTSSETERRGVILRMARLLLEEMGRPAEAALALAPLFGVVPPIAAVHQMMQRTLADAAARGPIIQRLEQLADEADPPTRLRVYEFLVKAHGETAAMSGARRRWFLRMADLMSDRADALRATVEGAIEQPDAVELWQTAETIAREVNQTEIVSRGYHRALGESATDPALAELLVRRMIAFEGEYDAASPLLVEALQRMLEHSPGARWAIDRVKLVLGSQARWDELFRIYDRAIAATADERSRADLLDEAAFAAKDLAARPERAIVYLESIHRLRPEDPAVESALERLYEKQGQTSALLELLDGRLARSTGFQRRELLGKMASLWTDLGNAREAIAIADRMLADGVPVADMTDLLERLAADPSSHGADKATPRAPDTTAQKRAIALLRAHYEAGRQIDDVVRMSERELGLAADAEARAACVRDLVALRLAAAEAASPASVFAQVIPRVEADVIGDVPLAKIAFEGVLQRALTAWKQPASPARDDAAEGAWRAIHILVKLLVESGKGEAALNLLTRCSRLPFERARRRELVREAALVCADRLTDPARAIRTFGELFEEDGGDEAAAKSLQRFATLLEEAGELPRLASLWEAQSEVHQKAGRAADERACWERAARLWERQGAVERAVAAYRRAGALGSLAAYEALARIHSERGAWADAVDALEWLAGHSPAEVRGLRALELADACVALGDRGRARAHLESALAAGVEAERVEQVPEQLITLYREDAAWRPLALLLAAQARRPGHPERRLASLREASDIHWRKLEEPAEAAALLQLAVTWYPGDPTLRPALADVLEASGQWEETARVLRDQVATYRDQRSKERALVHHRLAHALTQAGRVDGALPELRMAAEMQPAHPAILYDLGRAALSSGRLDLAESTYRALLLASHHSIDDAEAGPSGPHRAEVLVELSEVAARKNDGARAIDLVDSAVDAALESGKDPKRFEGPLAARGRYELLARSVERRVERADSLAARASALADLASLWAEHLDREGEVRARIARHAERMNRELEQEGLTDSAAWTALASAHRSLGDDGARIAMVQRRAKLLEAAIPTLKDGADRNRLRVELATTLLDDPSRHGDAVELLSSALADDPENDEAANRLADALERLERFDELVVVLQGRLRSEASVAVRTATTRRLGHALERAGRAGEALPLYECLLDAPAAELEGGTDAPAWLALLVERLEALGSERVADGLEKLLATGADAAIAQRLLDLRDRAGDADGVRRALELGFAADPRNVTIFRRLVDAYREAGDPGGTLRLLDPAIAARPEDAELLLLRSNARETLGDDDGALFDLEAAAVADANQVEALLTLHERVLARQTTRANGGSLPATSNVYAIRVVDVLLHNRRFEEARRELERLLSRNPTQADGLERMAALQGAGGNWPLAAETYRKLLPIAEAGDRDGFVRVVLAMADACERAGEAGAARDALESALAKAPESHDLMQRLERVCEMTGDVARLAHLLVAHAEREPTAPNGANGKTAAAAAEERTRLLVRAGLLLLDSAQDPTGALRVAERARAVDADSLDAVLLWASAQRRLGQPAEALAAIHAATARAKGKRTPVLARLHLEAARAHLAIDEIVEAFDSLKAGFSLDWRNAEIAMLLGLVAIDLDDEKLAERALSGLTTTPARDASGGNADATLQAGAFYRLALMAQGKGDRGKARRMATRAIGVEPGHAAARALLDQIEPPGGSPANRSGPRPAITPRS